MWFVLQWNNINSEYLIIVLPFKLHQKEQRYPVVYLLYNDNKGFLFNSILFCSILSLARHENV